MCKAMLNNQEYPKKLKYMQREVNEEKQEKKRIKMIKKEESNQANKQTSK